MQTCKTRIFVSTVRAFYEIHSSISEEPIVHALYADLENLLLTVLSRILKLDILISADEIFTCLLENLDNCLQNTIVNEQVELALDAQKHTFAETRILLKGA